MSPGKPQAQGPFFMYVGSFQSSGTDFQYVHMSMYVVGILTTIS